jgi:hypothetical protein
MLEFPEAPLKPCYAAISGCAHEAASPTNVSHNSQKFPKFMPPSRVRIEESSKRIIRTKVVRMGCATTLEVWHSTVRKP